MNFASPHDGEAGAVREAQADVIQALVHVEGRLLHGLVRADDVDDAAGQEQPHEARSGRTRSPTGQLIQVAAHNPKFFDPTMTDDPDFITQDIDAGRLLGTGCFLLDVQAHKLSTESSWLKVGNSLPYLWTGVSGPDHAGSV